MRPSLRLFGAELIDVSRRAEFPLVAKPGIGRAKVFFETEPLSPRVYPQRKAYLHGRYSAMLQNSKVILVFQNNNLTSEELSAIKAGVLGVKKPEGEEGVVMEMIRGGLLSGALKNAPELSELKKVLSGPMIAMHSSSPPSPAYLAALVTAINKATAFKPPARAPTPFTSIAALSVPPLASMPVNPKIFCVGAVVDGQVITADGVRTLGTLPDLDTLRAQVVGLISAPAAQLSGVLSAAAGGQLSRVLEGLKVKLGGGAEGEAEVAARGGHKAA